MSDYSRILPAITFYEEASRAEHGKNFVAQARSGFEHFQSNYYSSSTNPNYSENIKKFCYIYKYAVAHGYYIYAALKMLKPKVRPALFSRNPTRIACISGGPGTEIIGLCRYLREVEPENDENKVEITIFDKEKSWQEACNMILSCVSDNFKISVKFVEFDATNSSNYRDLDFSKFHLVTANFFISETRKAKIANEAVGFWRHLFKSMGTGKIFLAIDFADNEGLGWKHLNGLLPANHVPVIERSSIGQSCPDAKTSILTIEMALDHRPKKNGTNFIKAIIT